MEETGLVRNNTSINQDGELIDSSKSSKDRHLKKLCPVCLKTTRSDNLKRHLQIHPGTKPKALKAVCYVCEKVMHRNNLKRHLKIHSKSINESTDLLNDTLSLSSAENVKHRGQLCQQIYNEKTQTGSFVKRMLLETEIDHICLSKDLKIPLELYEQRQNSDMASSTLKCWQKDLLTLMDNLSDREIIWIIGKNGNEGKTWLQKYIEHHFAIPTFLCCI